MVDRVAIIPARGGSKRIPRKNIKPFLGTPLLVRTIGTLLAVDEVDRVIVSTEDDEIAQLATQAGAEVPFRRPPELADDHAATLPVVRHAIDSLERAGGRAVGDVCVAYPAAVFITPDDVMSAHQRLVAESAEFVMSAAAFPAPVQRALRIGEDGWASMLSPEHADARSQDLVDAYHDAGQFYWGTREAWLNGPHVMQGRTLLHVLPHWRVQDIDTPEDWERAELLWQLIEALAR